MIEIDLNRAWSITIVCAPPEEYQDRLFEAFQNAYDRGARTAQVESNTVVGHQSKVVDGKVVLEEHFYIQARVYFYPGEVDRTRTEVPARKPWSLKNWSLS